ncbi:hypothetical protein LGH82_30980 [Mesorhizobium sp. PAMC28654]|uniref:hypothetical protein n=1 Tax=Mesorhizobium sp. PAMC28654 TaxID=2880934 RepID=UPI001D0B5B44|nr:hypothetical protein [Mesorhizobium sp. PAMC28654]UDL89433.1 hypothetical protein LGH82_30980 [Mesorhizobium sp. PAMC28654]
MRRVVQAIELTLFLLLPLACALFLISLVVQATTDNPGPFFVKTQYYYFITLASPLANSGAQLISSLLAVLPLIVSTVCFAYDPTQNPPKVLTILNITGKISIILLIIGIVLATISNIIVSSPLSKFVHDVTNDDKNPDLLRAVFAGMISFQLIYLTQLLGLKK